MPTCCREAIYHRLHPPGSGPISTVCGWVGCLRYWDGSRSVPESRRPETACLRLFLTTFTGRATTTSGNGSCSRWSWPWMNGISLARPNEPSSLPGSMSPCYHPGSRSANSDTVSWQLMKVEDPVKGPETTLPMLHLPGTSRRMYRPPRPDSQGPVNAWLFQQDASLFQSCPHLRTLLSC